ncbi:MAG: hypothetical protein H6719_00875 [Sandaracinaceae bacterium]|nr:hypothetical protein [Sandaracinaceae bacterium]
MLDATLERWISDLTALDDGVELDRARETFHERTGAFEVGDAWYEERIRFFFDWYLCDFGGARRWLDAHPDAPDDERRLARACATAARSLYTVRAGERDELLLDDRLGGGRFALAASDAGGRLTPGETFDGRLVAVDGITLLGGIIFHPPGTHEALEALLEAIAPVDGDRTPVLDGLLRMRMRLDRFTSIRARHIYRREALDDADILSAAWARKGS